MGDSTLMATNNFKPFATGASANVTSQTDYEALAALQTGFQSGKASSAQINKALRQSSTMSAVLGQFITQASLDALDNGNVTSLLGNFITALTTNLSLGSASQRNVGTGANQIPDMSFFTYTTTGSGILIRLPGGIVIQMDEGTTDSNGYYEVNMGVALSSYFAFAVEGHVSGWTASGGKYLLTTKYGTEKISSQKFSVRSATWRDSDKSEIAQPTVFSWLSLGKI
ncbi:hypothetical protein [Cronobacter turicensis]|uniref:hypothetical protein n=1 Tax=Cronobacter turicensis TaxID=413502 RepID=UPI0011AD91F6|nr:hypothetical protein [Cronobacter turicensis]ELU8453302.1 hypothetical protein [Cronobacter turicensis]EMA1790118.1 hypothetical protein [Cronobacter turicensis]EMA1800182.1 hypothetical protein [Cronobacter turicensis]EMA1847395.1 hypothetical protein [Cronobacter turicensis]EMA1857640.1 hypothetical protein [Cronobacter turicensis]